MVRDVVEDRSWDPCDPCEDRPYDPYEPYDGAELDIEDWLSSDDAHEILVVSPDRPCDPSEPAPLASAPLAPEPSDSAAAEAGACPFDVAIGREAAVRAALHDERYSIRTSDPVAQRQYLALNAVPPASEEPIVRGYDLVMPRTPPMGCALYVNESAVARLVATRPFSLDLQPCGDGRRLVRLECAFLPAGCTHVRGAVGGAPFCTEGPITFQAARGDVVTTHVRSDAETELPSAAIEHADVVIWRSRRAVVAQVLCVVADSAGRPMADEVESASRVLDAWAQSLVRRATSLEAGPLRADVLVDFEAPSNPPPPCAGSEKARRKRRMGEL